MTAANGGVAAADPAGYLRENRIADVVEELLSHILAERPVGRAKALFAVQSYAANELKKLNADTLTAHMQLNIPTPLLSETPAGANSSFSCAGSNCSGQRGRMDVTPDDFPFVFAPASGRKAASSRTGSQAHLRQPSPSNSMEETYRSHRNLPVQPLLQSHRLSLACADAAAVTAVRRASLASGVGEKVMSDGAPSEASSAPSRPQPPRVRSAYGAVSFVDDPLTVTQRTMSTPSVPAHVPPDPSDIMDKIRDRALRTATTDVRRVVFTGGPCAGKSTGLALIKQQLERHGFHTLVAPEVASIMFEAGAGIAFNDPSDETIHAFQKCLFKLQRSMEDSLAEIAKACNRPAVVLCDRGALDGKAFCNNQMWDEIMGACGTSTEEVRDQRYDLVIHLVTAAEGAADFYTLENNVNRTETPEEAITQDHKLREMWSAHPKWTLIDNSTGFDEKLQRAMTSIMQLVGLDHKIKATAKYTLHNPPRPEHIPVPFKTSYVLIHVLMGTTDNFIHRLYKRVTSNGVTYSRQVIRKVGEDMQKVEEMLTEKGHMGLLHTADSEYDVISRMILSFSVGAQQYELALSQTEEIGYLYAEADGEDEVTLPSWILEREVISPEQVHSPRMSKAKSFSSNNLGGIRSNLHSRGTNGREVSPPMTPVSPHVGMSNSLFSVQSGFGWNMLSPTGSSPTQRGCVVRHSPSHDGTSTTSEPESVRQMTSDMLHCFSPSMVDISPGASVVAKPTGLSL